MFFTITYSVFVNALVLVSLHLLIPILMCVWLWRSNPGSRADWLGRALLCGSYGLLVYLAGSWHLMPSYYLRYLVAVLVATCLLRSSLKARWVPLWVRKTRAGRIRYTVLLALGVALLALDAVAVRGRWYQGEPIRLAFPLKGGTYYAWNTGGTWILNGHRVDVTAVYYDVTRAMQYAVDVVRIEGFGTIAPGFLPDDPDRYYSFGDTLYSPCDGRVLEVVNGHPDMSLSETIADSRHRARMVRIGRGSEIAPPVGNNIVLEHSGTKVFMTHLMKGSILVEPGDTVQVGQRLAQIGTSGPTFAPHLHIHAVRGRSAWSGTGVPIVFDGRFLVANDLVHR